jgi:hypothetical protein
MCADEEAAFAAAVEAAAADQEEQEVDSVLTRDSAPVRAKHTYYRSSRYHI